MANRLGEGPYKGVFALLSLASFGAAIQGYVSIEYIEYWEYWQPSRIAVLIQSFVIMPISLILLTSSYVSRGTRRLTRHPMLVGVALACFGHVLVNGDLAAILFFGGLGGYCILAMLWNDIQARSSGEEQDRLFLLQTGYLPSLTRLKKTPQDTLPRLGVLGPAVGGMAYGLAITYHGQVIGVSPLSSLVN
ncbi:hypothetical protein A9Q97_02355 [Rhodospirillales bacterium 47_12_T64]|nr:hypothetical protein A9Q97_02355 [Rhodospirillales bacterium 47_12_T64]